MYALEHKNNWLGIQRIRTTVNALYYKSSFSSVLSPIALLYICSLLNPLRLSLSLALPQYVSVCIRIACLPEYFPCFFHGSVSVSLSLMMHLDYLMVRNTEGIHICFYIIVGRYKNWLYSS